MVGTWVSRPVAKLYRSRSSPGVCLMLPTALARLGVGDLEKDAEGEVDHLSPTSDPVRMKEIGRLQACEQIIASPVL